MGFNSLQACAVWHTSHVWLKLLCEHEGLPPSILLSARDFLVTDGQDRELAGVVNRRRGASEPDHPSPHSYRPPLRINQLCQRSGVGVPSLPPPGNAWEATVHIESLVASVSVSMSGKPCKSFCPESFDRPLAAGLEFSPRTRSGYR